MCARCLDLGVGGGGSSFYRSIEFAKGSVQLDRQRDVSHMSLATLEKKQARIAEKAALQQRGAANTSNKDAFGIYGSTALLQSSAVTSDTAAVGPIKVSTRRRSRSAGALDVEDPSLYFDYSLLDRDVDSANKAAAAAASVHKQSLRSGAAKRKSHKSLHESIATAREDKLTASKDAAGDNGGCDES